MPTASTVRYLIEDGPLLGVGPYLVRRRGRLSVAADRDGGAGECVVERDAQQKTSSRKSGSFLCRSWPSGSLDPLVSHDPPLTGRLRRPDRRSAAAASRDRERSDPRARATVRAIRRTSSTAQRYPYDPTATGRCRQAGQRRRARPGSSLPDRARLAESKHP